VISPTHRTLPYSAQHSQQTDIHALGGIRTGSEQQQQIYALDRAAAVTGNKQDYMFETMRDVGKILQREISGREGEKQTARIETVG